MEGHREDAKERWQLIAFGAWLGGAGEKLKFDEYLSKLGLGVTTTTGSAPAKKTREQTLQDTAKIVQFDKRRNRK